MCVSYVNHSPVASFSSPVVVSADNPVSLGWPLKRTRKSIGFTGNFKVRLKKAIVEGEEIGRKASPRDVASKCKTIQTATGEKLFAKKEGL